MDAEIVRKEISTIPDESWVLIRKLVKSEYSRLLFRLMAATPQEARSIINNIYMAYRQEINIDGVSKIFAPGWIYAGVNCEKDEDIAPYAIAEALDPGNELEPR